MCRSVSSASSWLRRFVHDPSYLRRGIKKIDWTGIGLLAVALTSMQIVLERGQQENWFDSNLITTGTIISVAAAVALVCWELKTDEPVVNLRLLRNIPLSLGSSWGSSSASRFSALPSFCRNLPRNCSGTRLSMPGW